MTKAPAKPKKPNAYEQATPEKLAYGTRMREAREIAGLSATDAAHALGYVQPVQLSYIENGTRMPPEKLIKRAAHLYGTTTDFLHGLVPDSDRDPAQCLQRYLAARVHSDVRALINQWSDLSVDAVRKLMPTTAEGTRLANLALESHKALQAIRAANPKFDTHMKGANPLLSKLDLAANAAREYLEQIARAQRVMHVNSLRDAGVADGGNPIAQLDLLPNMARIDNAMTGGYPAW